MLRKRRLAVLGGIVAVLAVVASFRALTAEARPEKPYLKDSPMILAHQGASGHAPSNTMPSFQLAMTQGADVLELDVHMTRDGVIVVSHDETIDRMSSGSGYIKSMTLQELRQYDFGFDFTPDGGKTFPYRGKGVTIPTLEDVFKAYPNTRINIEIKQLDPAMEEPLWALVQRYDMYDKVLINSFYSEAYDRWTGVAGDRVAVGANRGHMYEYMAYYLPRATWMYHPKVDAFQLPLEQKLGPFTIRFDTRRFIDTAHRLGIKVHYWTINDEATMRHLLSIGADGIITDFPDRAAKVQREAGFR
ncbi:MAG TPA: glycerophosphodiester phosphodiesterase [Symbiobacteriaceae bacterium]|nr:glycerophosphodiester phosphodiesterase [Symbiobacteriaceae bacterium]